MSTKYKIIKKEVQRLDMEGTTNCEICGGLMKVFMNYGYEERECLSCGATFTTEKTRP